MLCLAEHCVLRSRERLRAETAEIPWIAEVIENDFEKLRSEGGLVQKAFNGLRQ